MTPSHTRTGIVTLRDNPMTLQGAGVRVGELAPDFIVTSNAMKPVSLIDYRESTVILSSVPSLDTPVCDIETRTFNERASALGDNVVVLTISMDLPMAQKRWCGAHGVDRVVTLSDYRLSDYKDRSFSDAFGLRMKENGLLARAVYVIDPTGMIIYEQIVPEITHEPDYDAVLNAVH